jgi:hypothetical protein
MGLFDWLLGTGKKASDLPPVVLHQGPKVNGEDKDAVATGALTRRLPGGSVVVDLRKATMDELVSTAAFKTTKAELAKLDPTGIVCWMLPGAAIDAWNAKGNFVEVITAWSDGGGCKGQTCTMICGTAGHTAAFAFALRSMGHQLFVGEVADPAPILEVALSGGKMIAGISAKELP